LKNLSYLRLRSRQVIYTLIDYTEFLDDFILTFQMQGFRDLENISRNILTKEIN